jgi:hypothetical protein
VCRGQMRKTSPLWSFALSLAIVTLAPGQPHAQNLTVLYGFCVPNCIGAGGPANLTVDADGNLFGTAGSDLVFEIAKTAGGYAATPTVLVPFTQSLANIQGLTTNAYGSLFGTSVLGGAYSSGSIFRITKTNRGEYNHTPITLVNFNEDNNGPYYPMGLMIEDNNAFLTTVSGTPSGDNAIIKIPKTHGVYGAPVTLVTFNAADQGGLLADANGDLFGTIETAGSYPGGAVFELAKTKHGYAHNLTILASFANPSDGVYPTQGLAFDAAGNLFGMTSWGGTNGVHNGLGTVFEIAKTEDGYTGTPTTLASFGGTNGENPVGGLIVDANGDLFGTTELGGPYAGNGYGDTARCSRLRRRRAVTPVLRPCWSTSTGRMVPIRSPA